MKADNSGITQAPSLSQQDIANHKALIGFDDKDAKLLKTHGAVVEGALDAIIDKFYQQQLTIAEVQAVLAVDERLPRLKTTMKQYIRELFIGDYGSAYVKRRLEIGKAHENLGVGARYYLAAIYQLENLLRDTIPDRDSQASAPLRSALHKVMEFDVQIVMDQFISNLMAKVKVAQDELEDYAEGLEEVVTERTRQLHELSRKDELTELFNRRGMQENMRRELANAARYKERLSFICFTLNDYRQLVAKKGQAIGDVVLNQIGHDIKAQIREADIACRAADDEFCIIMPRTQSSEAEAICKRLIEMFKKDNQHNLSFSMGISTTNSDEVMETDHFINLVEGLMRKAAGTPGFNVCVGK